VAPDQALIDAAHYPGFSNWLVPRALCVGRYPYPVTPYGTTVASPALELCQKHLQHLVQEGNISTFICMQAEIPPSFAEGTFKSESWTDPGIKASFLPYFEDAVSFAAEKEFAAPEFLHVSSRLFGAACLPTVTLI
jgi:hypothetical protein